MMSSHSSTSEDIAKTESPGAVSSSATSWFSEAGNQEFGPSLLDGTWPLGWDDRAGKIIIKPYDYLISLGGKGFREQFLEALNVWLKVDAAPCGVINETITMLHNSSLLIDDIQDDSRYQRGSLAAHEVYGIAQTINTANLVCFKAQKLLMQLDPWPQLIRVFNEELLQLHQGQGMELYWRDTLQPPSEADYLQMILHKTGGVFRLTLRLLQTLSSCQYDIQPLAETIGLMFQIVDDYKNLKDCTMTTHKGFYEDLTEGKFSFPISHAIWTNSKYKGELLRILKLKTTNEGLKRSVVECLEESGSLEYTRKVIQSLQKRANDLLSQIDEPNSAMEKLISRLVVT